jgi:transcriptional regulator with XRE-family HTH domain
VASNLDRTLARRLRQVAEARGLPLSHAADQAGVSRSHLWAILKAETTASLTIVVRLATVFKVHPVTLLVDPADTDTLRAITAPVASLRGRRRPR